MASASTAPTSTHQGADPSAPGAIDPLSTANAADGAYTLSVEPCLVTLRHAGETVAETSCAIRAERTGEPPVLFVPKDDIRCEGLLESGRKVSADGLGRARVLDVVAGGQTLKGAAYCLEDTTALGARLTGRIGFDPSRFDGALPPNAVSAPRLKR